MVTRHLSPDEVPSFAWDRHATVRDIREQLRSGDGSEWRQTAAWILREASLPEVWQFLTPDEVRDRLSELEPLLGRRRGLWRYLIGAWHELGRL